VVKPDVEVTSPGLDGWKVPVNVPEYSVDNNNPLVKLRAYLVPDGQTLPGTATELVATAWPFVEADVAGQYGGVQVVLVLPEVPPGSKHTAIVVRGFDL